MSIPFVDDSGNIRRQVSDIVFANSVGRVWNEPGFLNLINRIIESYNEEAEENGKEKLENFCPHMARHTYTTLAYSAGADVKAVSEILGHASTSVTIDTYAHLTEEKKRKQEEVIKTIKDAVMAPFFCWPFCDNFCDKFCDKDDTRRSKTKRWQIREVLILRRITQDKTR